MRYDDDRYLDDEEDKDFWDDELELSSDDSKEPPEDIYDQSYSQTTSYPDDEDHYEDHYADHEDHSEENGENDFNDENSENAEDDYYSDQESKEPVRLRRERFFGKRDIETEDEGNDYFDSEAEPTPPPRRKSPKLDPEDPDYWIEEEESPLSGIMTGKTEKWKWILAAAVALLIGIAGGWIWFFRPYADNAVKYGYINNMERRGSLFKTFEGTIIPYKELGDPDPLYFKEVRFSVASDSLAARMKRMMLGCVPVRIEYETYHAPLPWKGEERMVIIKADTADPHKILPPEYRGKD